MDCQSCDTDTHVLLWNGISYHIEPESRYLEEPPNDTWVLLSRWPTLMDAYGELWLRDRRDVTNKTIKEFLRLYGLNPPVLTQYIPNRPGIYFFTNRRSGEIEYIGISQTLRQRLSHHEKYDRDRHEIYILEVQIGSVQQYILENIEIALIGLVRPRLNIAWKPLGF